MTKLTTMDKRTAGVIDKAVENALRPVAEAMGLDLKMKGGRFDPSAGMFMPRMELTLQTGQDGRTQEQITFEKNCESFLLKPENYKAQLTTRHGPCELIGFALSRSKFPIRARVIASGKEILFTEAILKQIRPEPKAVLGQVLTPVELNR